MLKKEILENLHSKKENDVREAVESLWELVKSGGNVEEAVPYLLENQAHLSGFTDASQVLAAYFLKTQKFGQLEKLLENSDKKVVEATYRGIFMAHANGVSAENFLKEKGGEEKLRKIAASNKRLLPPEEYGLGA